MSSTHKQAKAAAGRRMSSRSHFPRLIQFSIYWCVVVAMTFTTYYLYISRCHTMSRFTLSQTRHHAARFWFYKDHLEYVSYRTNHWTTESRDSLVQWFGRRLTRYVLGSLASFSGSDGDLLGPPLATDCSISMFATTNFFTCFYIFVAIGD